MQGFQEDEHVLKATHDDNIRKNTPGDRPSGGRRGTFRGDAAEGEGGSF